MVFPLFLLEGAVFPLINVLYHVHAHGPLLGHYAVYNFFTDLEVCIKHGVGVPKRVPSVTRLWRSTLGSEPSLYFAPYMKQRFVIHYHVNKMR